MCIQSIVFLSHPPPFPILVATTSNRLLSARRRPGYTAFQVYGQTERWSPSPFLCDRLATAQRVLDVWGDMGVVLEMWSRVPALRRQQCTHGGKRTEPNGSVRLRPVARYGPSSVLICGIPRHMVCWDPPPKGLTGWPACLASSLCLAAPRAVSGWTHWPSSLPSRIFRATLGPRRAACP